MKIDLLKKYIKSIIKEEVNKAISLEIKEQIKNILYENFISSIKNNKSNEMGDDQTLNNPVLENKTFAPENISLNDALNDIASDGKKDVQPVLPNNQQLQNLNSPPKLSLTKNPKIDKILTDMVNQGYTPLQSEASMNPLYEMTTTNNNITTNDNNNQSNLSQINATGMKLYNTSKQYTGPYGTGYIAPNDPNEIDILNNKSYNKKPIQTGANVEFQNIQPSQNTSFNGTKNQSGMKTPTDAVNIANKAITRNYSALMSKLLNK